MCTVWGIHPLEEKNDEEGRQSGLSVQPNLQENLTIDSWGLWPQTDVDPASFSGWKRMPS